MPSDRCAGYCASPSSMGIAGRATQEPAAGIRLRDAPARAPGLRGGAGPRAARAMGRGEGAGWQVVHRET